MNVVMRCAILVRPKEPFLEWAANTDADAHKHIDGVHMTSVYLVESVDTHDAEDHVVRKHFARIFEEQLDSWYTDQDAWPQKRDLLTFRKWFDVETQSLVVDLADEPMEVEEW